MMKLPCEHIKLHILLVIILFIYSACSLSDWHDNDEEIEKISQEIRDEIEGELVYETEFSKVYKYKLGKISIKLSDYSLCVPRWSNDGSNIAFLEYQRTDNGGETRLIITDQNGVEVENWLIDVNSECVSWSPDNKTIAMLNGYWHIVYIDIETGETEQFVVEDNPLAQFFSLAWCPIKNKIAISGIPQKIWMINPFENNPEKELLSDCDIYVYHMDWNHEGTKLTYSDKFFGSI